MTNSNSSLIQLKEFLNKLFQFDSQDLDFGVYKILHYKKKEIADFIDSLLVGKVQDELKSLTDDEVKQANDQLKELEKDDIIRGWLEADDNEKRTLEKFGKDKINHYKGLKTKATEATVSAETENQIYNHLTLFFSRYYDKGDFISKRRFGKNEKYVVPYNGEETHFHWANHDQYYIKSSETFSHYSFKVQTSDGNLVVNFKLHDAQLEQGNVKAEAANFFLLADKAPEIKEKADSDLNFVLANKQPDINEKEITIYFEYRPLGDQEKSSIKGNSKQDSLDELAFEFLKKELSTNPLLASLWKEQDGKPILLKKLQHYTRKNKHDFFIHKNLKGFLERELDYYIKSELVVVDDLYVTDTDTYFDRLKFKLKSIKVFKSIADTIIDFVSQIEDFQKKLWEKKKFVLSTEWVITIDRLVEYIGEAAAKRFLEEVIANEKQVAEWKELFGEENIPVDLSIDTLKADLHEWRKLPIDTLYFENTFKYDLINQLSLANNLDSKADGMVFHSDNFHGLHILQSKYSKKIQAFYCDPPYNTSASEILYKNSFKNSSWLSLIAPRLELSKELARNGGTYCFAIDDSEMTRLKFLMDSIFNQDNCLGVVVVKNNPSGRSTAKGVSISHEYLLFYGNDENSQVGRLARSEKQNARYNQTDNLGAFEWVNFRKHGGENANRIRRPKLFYPVFCCEKSRSLRIPKMTWEETSREWNLEEEPKENEEIVLPINRDGEHKTWKWGIKKVESNILDFDCKKDQTGGIGIYMKSRLNDLGMLPISVWDSSTDSSTEHGTNLLTRIFGKSQLFSFPKSVQSVVNSLRVLGLADNQIVVDYFPGSGTTFHATQLLNRSDSGKRKCLLIEQGGYIYSVIIPRIKKIAYTFDWKDGKPKNGSMDGLGVFFKYQRLEQYEEALENIAFNASENALQKALEFDQYIPKYFLEFETRGSQTLVNTAAMQDPWDYKLKVWDGFTYDTEQAVDLVETFNYLIGLHMQKCITKKINGKKYQFIVGHNNAEKKIAVVWRSVKGWSLEDFTADSIVLKEELKAFSYDLLYLNDQAHLEGYQPIEEVFKNKMLN